MSFLLQCCPLDFLGLFGLLVQDVPILMDKSFEGTFRDKASSPHIGIIVVMNSIE